MQRTNVTGINSPGKTVFAALMVSVCQKRDLGQVFYLEGHNTFGIFSGCTAPKNKTKNKNKTKQNKKTKTTTTTKKQQKTKKTKKQKQKPYLYQRVMQRTNVTGINSPGKTVFAALMVSVCQKRDLGQVFYLEGHNTFGIFSGCTAPKNKTKNKNKTKQNKKQKQQQQQKNNKKPKKQKNKNKNKKKTKNKKQKQTNKKNPFPGLTDSLICLESFGSQNRVKSGHKTIVSETWCNTDQDFVF